MSLTSRSFLPFALSLLLFSCGNSGKENGSKTDTGTYSPTVDSTGRVVSVADEHVDEPVLLQYRFTPGKAFRFYMRHAEEMEQKRDTIGQGGKTLVEYWFTFTPKSGQVLEGEITRVKYSGKFVTTQTGAQELSYDSENAADSSRKGMLAQFTAALHHPFFIKVSSVGSIDSIWGLEGIENELLGTDAARTKLETKMKIRDDYARNVLKGTLQLIFQKLHDKPVTVDSSWSITQDAMLGYLQVQHHAIYRLAGRVDDGGTRMEKITMTMKSKYAGPKIIETGQGNAEVREYHVTGGGTAFFDMDKHRAVSRSLHQNLNLKVFVEIPQELKEATNNQFSDFYMTQTAKISTEVKEIQ